ncbi:MAG: winged helix-turn-helix domain-containing protein [Tranquillimonas sp.]
MSNRSYDQLLDDIRARICLAPPDLPFVLHENQLASEFGLSRTPVRQALQRIELEGMVEVRTGVGTVATQLDPRDRTLAFEVYRELAAAAASCAHGDPIADEVKVELAGLHGVLTMQNHRSAQTYVKTFGQIANAMAMLVRDEILRRALLTAHWRIVRWRVRDFHAEPDETWQSLVGNMQRIVDVLPMDDAAYVLRTAAGISSGFVRPQPTETAAP